MNYKSLLSPMNTTLAQTLLGQSVFIRRLTTKELNDYSAAVDIELASNNDSHTLSMLGVGLFLNALVNEDGSRPKVKDLPTVTELLATHSSADLLEAVTAVQRHSFGTLEDASKN